jgi:hypothetical protein
MHDADERTRILAGIRTASPQETQPVVLVTKGRIQVQLFAVRFRSAPT